MAHPVQKVGCIANTGLRVANVHPLFPDLVPRLGNSLQADEDLAIRFGVQQIEYLRAHVELLRSEHAKASTLNTAASTVATNVV
jgi:hypothetical protein